MTGTTKWGARKPPVGQRVEIDWSHPLAHGLRLCCVVNEGGGPVRDLVRGRRLVRKNAATWGIRAGVLGALTNTDDAGYTLTTPADLKVGAAFSVMWRGVPLGSATGSASWGGCSYDSGNAPPYTSWVIGLNGAGTAAVFNTNDGASFDQVTGPTVTANAVASYLATRGTAASKALTLYGNGVSVATGTTVNAVDTTYSATSEVVIGEEYSTTRNPQVLTACLYFWARVLPQAEALWLHREPFAFLTVPAYRRVFGPSAAAPVGGKPHIYYAQQRG